MHFHKKATHPAHAHRNVYHHSHMLYKMRSGIVVHLGRNTFVSVWLAGRTIDTHIAIGTSTITDTLSYVDARLPQQLDSVVCILSRANAHFRIAMYNVR